jgi:hypothetical protein
MSRKAKRTKRLMGAAVILMMALLPGPLAGAQSAAGAGEELPILRTSRPVVSVQEGETLHRDAWRLAPEVKPDLYQAELKDGRPMKVTFISDLGSLSFDVVEGRQYDFVILHGEERCYTRIVGIRAVPAAVFDAAYRSAHAGKIDVEVPEVYELVNIAIAMTPTGLADRNLVYHDSDYYAAMRRWFDPFKDHPALAALDAALKQGPAWYPTLKMNGYAFAFDAQGRIVQSPVYDRTGFSGERRNTLRAFIPQLQAFADASKFRDFYHQQQPAYAAQIAFYAGGDGACGGGGAGGAGGAGVEAMRAWLDLNFPGAAGYGGYKIIFSPLVAYSQSATWLESDGYRELQAHVNFPYPQDVARRTHGATLSKTAETILRGDIVFTELNHGYINPEGDRYAGRVTRATSHRERWVDPARGADYYAGISAFNEYMNWGLVSLRAIDFAPAGEQQTLIAIVDEMMTQRRGFPRFAAFDAFLVDLYRHRAPGTTVAQLYPRIIEWFEKETAAGEGG